MQRFPSCSHLRESGRTSPVLPGGPDSSKCYSLPQQDIEELSHRKWGEDVKVLCLVVDLASSSLPARRPSAGARVCVRACSMRGIEDFVHYLYNFSLNTNRYLLKFILWCKLLFQWVGRYLYTEWLKTCISHVKKYEKKMERCKCSLFSFLLLDLIKDFTNILPVTYYV